MFYQLARACGGFGLAEERRAALARFSELAKKEKDDAEARRRAAKLVEEARELLQSGDLEGAGQRLELARVARDYAQPAWLYRYLLCLVEKSANRLPDAKASLEAAARLNPSEAPVLNALGEVVLLQGRPRGGDSRVFGGIWNRRGARIKQCHFQDAA